MMSISVLLADDHKLVRESLRNLIEFEYDIDIVAAVEDGEKAVEFAHKLNPDISILDISMPKMNGIKATYRIKAHNPETKIIMLTMHSSEDYITKMLRAGVSGYLSKDCAFEELVSAIRTVNAGRIYISQEITTVMLINCIRTGYKLLNSPQSILTEIEQSILKYLFEFKEIWEIAELLNITIQKVDTHCREAITKIFSEN